MSIDPAVFGPLTLNSTTLAVTDVTLELAAVSDIQRLQHSANRFDSVLVRTSGEPRIRFSTPARGALDLLTVDGLKITSLAAWLCKFADFRRSVTATDDSQINFNTNAVGFAYIDSISVAQGQMAMANCVLEILQGTATTDDPIKVGVLGEVPTLSAEPIINTVGPIKIDGSAIDGVRSVNLSFGHQFTRLPADGKVYASTGQLVRSAPEVSADIINPVAWLPAPAAEGIAGKVVATSFELFLREFDNATQLLNGKGISFLMTKASQGPVGRYTVEQLAGRPAEAVVAKLRAMFATYNDVNPLVLTASKTI
jgi:hypothetical protein